MTRATAWRWYVRVINVAVLLLRAWALMLILGIAHDQDERIPTFGFIVCGYLLMAFELGIFGYELRTELEKQARS